MKRIESLSALNEVLKQNKKVWLLLYKKGSAQSDCAFQNFNKISENIKDTTLMVADVNRVRDIHPWYNIKSVPSLLEFKEAKMANIIKGCHSAGQYNAVIKNSVYIAQASGETKKVNRVVVYSTPTCTWCTTLKRYLDENKIRYRDVDVSKDPQAAEAMVKKSGQQGVPQTEINGQVIVGFDREKINNLLNIN
ncbi:MAG: NrdH-redoxin [Chlorobi bacterium]|nr:NrdH-redoxin [Chlorobiota bacterium]